MAIDPPATPPSPELADLDPAFDLTTFATEGRSVHEPLRRAELPPAPRRLARNDIPHDYRRHGRLTDSGIQLAIAGVLVLGAIAIVVLALRGRQAPFFPATPARPPSTSSAAPTPAPAATNAAATGQGGEVSAPSAPQGDARAAATPPAAETQEPARVSEPSRKGTVPQSSRKSQRPVRAQSTISVNAKPWATVWLDGRQIGETPLANIRVPVGTHEVVFRHPQLGERRLRAIVEAGVPARVTADLRR